MDGKWTLAVVIAAVFLAPFIFFVVIRCVRADYVVIYRRFKKPVQTMGVIEWVECVNIPKGGCYYIITYSYTDNVGKKHTVAFRWHKKIGWTDCPIVVHFDSQAPENCISDYQLEFGRRIWRNILEMFLSALVFAVFGILFFFKMISEV